jgi:hypothetical protein
MPVRPATTGAITIGATNATGVTLGSSTALLVVKGSSSSTLTFTNGTGSSEVSVAAPAISGTTNFQLPAVTGTTGQTYGICTSFGNCSSNSAKSVTKIVAMGTASSCSGTTPVASGSTAGADFVSTSCTASDAVIQSAITALPASGGTIYLEEGTYILSGTVTIPSNVTLEGSGQGTVLEYENSYNTGSEMLYIPSGTGVRISNLRLDGNTSHQTGAFDEGIYVGGTGIVNIDNVQSNHFTDYGFYFSGGTDTLTNSYATGNVTGGVNDLANNTVISNTTASTNSGRGFVVGSTGDTISDDVAYGNTGIGFYANSAINSSFTGDVADTNSSEGYFIDSYDTLSDSIARNNTSYGIGFSAGATDDTVSNNTLEGNQADAINILGSSYDDISGNIITIYSTGANDGVDATNLAHSNIEDNNITGTGGTGVGISLTGSGSYSDYLAGNTLSGTGGSSITDSSSGTDYGSQQTGNGDVVLQGTGAIDVGSSAQGTATLSVTGGVNTTALSAPSWGFSGGVTETGGSATTWGYEVTALDGTGESLPSTQKTTTTGGATLSGVIYNTVAFPYQPGAVKYNVYRTQAGAGHTPSTTGLVTSITAGTLVATNGTATFNTSGLISWNDTGFAAGAAVPVVNTTGGILVGVGSSTPTLSFANANSNALIDFGSAATAVGNTLSITGQTAGGTANNGGAVTVQGGTATTTGTGGTTTIQGGAASATAGSAGGAVDVYGAAGASATTAGAAGGALNLQSGVGGNATTSGTAGAGGGINITAANGGNSSSGVGGNGGSLLLEGGNGGTSTSGTNAGGGNITLDAGSVGTGGANGTAGSVIVKNASNSSTAFQVQNVASDSVLGVQTGSTDANLIGNPSFESPSNTTGWATEGNGTVSVAADSYPSPAFFAVDGNNELDADITTGAADAGVTSTSFVGGNPAAGQYTLSFSVRTDLAGLTSLRAGYNSTACSTFNDGGNADTLVETYEWTHFYCTFTAGVAISSIFIDEGGSSSPTIRNLYIDAVQLEAGAAETPFRSGESSLSGSLVINGGSLNTLDAIPLPNSTSDWAETVNQLNGGSGLLVQAAASQALASNVFQVESDGAQYALQSINDGTGSTEFKGGSSFWDTAAVNIAPSGAGLDPLRVEDENGNDLLSVSASTTNMVEASNFENPNICSLPPNWVVKGVITNGVSGSCANGDPSEDTTNPFEDSGSLKAVLNGSTTNSGMQTTSFTTPMIATDKYEMTFWAKCSVSITTLIFGYTDTGGDNSQDGTGDTCNTSWQQYSANFTAGTGPTAIYVDSGATDTINDDIWIDAVSLVQTSTNAASNYDPGQIYLTGVVASPTIFQNSANSTEALQVQNASGSSVLTVDTADGYISLGKASSLTGQLNLFNASSASSVGLIASSGTNNYTLTLPGTAPSVNQCLAAGASTATSLVFSSCAASTTLQTAYNNSSAPANITLADSKDFTITAPDTTTDPNIVFTLSCQVSCGSNGRFAVQTGSSPADTLLVSPNGQVRIGSSSNNVTYSASTGEPTLSGTAEHTRLVTISAEYAGATFAASGTNNSGTMTATNMTTSPFRNYYDWKTTQATAQNYDIWVKVPLPTDFTGFPSGQEICLDVYASATTANTIKLTLYDTTNTSVSLGTSDLTPSSSATWQNKCSSSITGGSYTANNDMTLDFTLTAPATTGEVRIGDITYSYLSKF